MFPSVVFKQVWFTCACRRTQVLCSEVRAVASPPFFYTCEIVVFSMGFPMLQCHILRNLKFLLCGLHIQCTCRQKRCGQNVSPGDGQAGLLPFLLLLAQSCWECCCCRARETGAGSARKSQSCAGGCWKPSPVPLFSEE